MYKNVTTLFHWSFLNLNKSFFANCSKLSGAILEVNPNKLLENFPKGLWNKKYIKISYWITVEISECMPKEEEITKEASSKITANILEEFLRLSLEKSLKIF